MNWPPEPGELLPRADACWHEPIKFEEWILAPRGHGREWQEVFGVGAGDRERVWQALASAARTAAIVEGAIGKALESSAESENEWRSASGARWSP